MMQTSRGGHDLPFPALIMFDNSTCVQIYGFVVSCALFVATLGHHYPVNYAGRSKTRLFNRRDSLFLLPGVASGAERAVIKKRCTSLLVK